VSEGRQPEARKPTLDDMVDVIAREASRRRSSQEALVAAGLRSGPDADQLWEAEVMETAVRLIDRLRPHMPAIRAMIAGQKVR
jgi:hypothetical protein